MSNAQPAGMPVPGLLRHANHNTEATSIAMRFWARSIGDRNPRHVIEAYRSSTGGVGFSAHPCWLYSVQDTVLASGPKGTCPIIAGTDWIFRRSVGTGERITTVARLESEKRSASRFAGECLIQTVSVQYLDSRMQEIAHARSTLFHVQPEAAREAGKHKAWRRWRYTREELDAIERDYDAEHIRGDEPRYWEEVEVGDEIPAIVRGPLSSEEIVLFVGATRPIPGMAAFTRAMSTHDEMGFIHPRTGSFETYAAGLVDDESAQQLGFPAAHDYGIDRISQMTSLLTNWSGDAGQLMSMKTRLLAPNMLGDTTWFRGRVTSKQDPVGTTGLIEVEISGTNQRGEATLRGAARLALPRRVPKGPHPD